MASRWQHCFRFDQPEISTSNIPLQRRTRYPSTNWPVTKGNNKQNSFHHELSFHQRSFRVNLHSVRFSSVFFTFLLLLDKVCAFSSAFLYVHIRTNQTVTYWTKVFRKKFFVKWYSSISKYRSYRSYTKFLSIYDSLLSADMDL